MRSERLRHSNAAAEARPLEGIYSSVCLTPELGDQGGMELRLVRGGPRPVVRFSVCEGGCWEEPVTAARLAGRVLRFTSVQTLYDASGRVSDRLTHRQAARFGRRAVTLSSDRPGRRSERLPWRGRVPQAAPPGVGPPAMGDWPTPWRRCS